MSLQHGSIKKNGNVLLDDVDVWMLCDTEGPGGNNCSGYFNPEWEDPLGVNDPDQESDPRYELVLDSGDTLPIRVWDHRDVYFIQCNQNGYRTVHFRTAQ
ncbi:MAG TPA: hypothetical protein VKA55_07440 [Gammaproteobacteria bacterium]|nr:hypothetical protein [Gammaproteobacteria bacterium]